jgi:hypothetical protein
MPIAFEEVSMLPDGAGGDTFAVPAMKDVPTCSPPQRHPDRSSYTPVAGDAGKTLKVTVTGTKAGYTTTASTSTATGAVAAA